MAYNFDLNKFLKNLRGPKGLSTLTEEFDRIKTEVARLRKSYEPQAQRKMKQLQVQLKGMKTKWEKNQGKFEKELEKTLGQVKKAAHEAESNLKKAIKVGKTSKKKAPARKAKKTTRAKRG